MGGFQQASAAPIFERSSMKPIADETITVAAPKSRAGESRLSSVAAAILVLKAFSEEDAEIGISSLAKRLGQSKSTAHRLATTLLAGGMLEQNPDNGRYRLGVELFALGALVRHRLDVSNQAMPYLRSLRRQTGETVHLAILDNTSIMYLHNLESTQAIRMRSYIGVRKPAFCTAEGLAILAFRPEQVITNVLQENRAARTPKTKTASGDLLRALEQVRAEGYAIDDEESELGMRSIAAPIRDMTGVVVAAVGIGGPTQRLTKKALRGMAVLLLDCAETISNRVGYRGRS
jgi:IclR family KDG regulon transcriptional repressor